MNIHESAENYLETILVIGRRNGYVRAIDVCGELGFSKPSVSVFLKRFRENGYIEVDELGHITLTPKGRAVAERTYERHQVIGEFLVRLGVSRETAYLDACKMEHDLSDETVERMRKSVKGEA